MRPALLALLAPLVATLLASPSGADETAELEALRIAIAERRERVAAYQDQEDGLFAAVEAVEQAARALRNEVASAQRVAREADRERARLEAERKALELRAAGTRAALARRSVALYKAGGAGPVRLVFSPGTLRDRLGRIQAIQLLLDQDQRLLERHAAEQAELVLAGERLDEAVAQSAAAKQKLAQRQRELAGERRAKESLLEDVRRDRARERALLNELEAAALALEQKLAELARVSKIAPDAVLFSSRRGELEPPVPGKVLRRFGRVVDAEYRTETFQKGMDFEVIPGEEVYVVADGFVRFAGWFSGYGRMVIVDHGEGWFTVSGHLESSSVDVGARVRAGDVIGSAGETGSLTGPRLYFEIRQGATAQDPADWLGRLW